MNTDEDYRIEEFEEKPENPKSNLASMGIYIFTWKTLKKYLQEDDKLDTSSHDFGHDIIPKYLEDGRTLIAHPFRGYWKDVGTVNSLWESNMDLIDHAGDLDLSDRSWRIYSEDKGSPAQVIGATATVKSAYIDKGAIIDGTVEHSVISTDVQVNQNAVVKILSSYLVLLSAKVLNLTTSSSLKILKLPTELNSQETSTISS